MSKWELLTCNFLDSKNKYDVFVEGERVFYAHETTPFCIRQTQRCFPDCAP